VPEGASLSPPDATQRVTAQSRTAPEQAQNQDGPRAMEVVPISEEEGRAHAALSGGAGADSHPGTGQEDTCTPPPRTPPPDPPHTSERAGSQMEANTVPPSLPEEGLPSRAGSSSQPASQVDEPARAPRQQPAARPLTTAHGIPAQACTPTGPARHAGTIADAETEKATPWGGGSAHHTPFLPSGAGPGRGVGAQHDGTPRGQNEVVPVTGGRVLARELDEVSGEDEKPAHFPAEPHDDLNDETLRHPAYYADLSAGVLASQ